MNKLTLEKIKLITAMVIFGTIGLFVRNIPLPSSVIALSRGTIGVLFLLLITALKRTGISQKAIKANLGRLILSGAFIGMNWILLFEAYRYTTVATATLCYYLAPTMVILAAPFVLKEKLTQRKLLCAVVALCGMVCVSGVLDSGVLAGIFGGSTDISLGDGAGILEGDIIGSFATSGELTGILYGLGAAVLYACIILINKKIHDISAYDKPLCSLEFPPLCCCPTAF